MLGDASLFTRADEVEAAWAIVDPIIDAWLDMPAPEFPNYAAGTWGPDEADELIFAAGKLAEFREQLERMSRGDFMRLLDPAIGQAGLLHGERLVHAMREVVGDPLIETLPVHFTAAAVDLQRQREVWLRSGPLWDAIRASFAIPGLFTPHTVHGRELVDGGLLAPLPIAATRLSDAHRLIAVDMHGWPQRPPGEPAAQRRSRRTNHCARASATGSNASSAWPAAHRHRPARG